MVVPVIIVYATLYTSSPRAVSFCMDTLFSYLYICVVCGSLNNFCLSKLLIRSSPVEMQRVDICQLITRQLFRQVGFLRFFLFFIIEQFDSL